MQAGNIQGVAVGAMVCAIIAKCVGTKVMLNGAPTYLVGGCLAIACLSLLAGGLMYVLHPHEVGEMRGGGGGGDGGGGGGGGGGGDREKEEREDG